MLRWLTVLVVVALAVLTGSPAAGDNDARLVRYDNHSLVRVYPRSWKQIEEIHALGALLLSDAEGIGPVDYLVSPDAMRSLAAMDLRWEVLVENYRKECSDRNIEYVLTTTDQPYDRMLLNYLARRKALMR